jgi:hypothetical protein
MSRCASNSWLARLVALSIAVLAVASWYFYQAQNTADRIGGAMAPQKLFWLGYAILLWVVLPLAIALDRRVAKSLRNAFAALFLLMLVRGLIELWMLYVTLNWSPWYGIAHDLLCMAVLISFTMVVYRRERWRDSPDALIMMHLLVTTAAFVPEIYFAHYMTINFNTTGTDAIYFVPDEERFRDVLAWTTRVVVFLSIYLPFFLWRWLVGTSDGASAQPR